MIKEDDDTVVVSSFIEEKMSEPETEESVAESVAEESEVRAEKEEETQKIK
jgi:hypothetical protein